MYRRELFKVIGVAGLATDVVAQGHHQAPESHLSESELVESYQPRFFTEVEYQTIKGMCETLLPADTDSPGAKEAGVAFYLDTTLHYAPDKLKQVWKTGVHNVNDSSLQMFNKSFSAVSSTEQQQLFDRFFADEQTADPANPEFFSLFKRMAIEGFCYSEVGMHDYLRYQGETAIPFFPGCKST